MYMSRERGRGSLLGVRKREKKKVYDEESSQKERKMK